LHLRLHKLVVTIDKVSILLRTTLLCEDLLFVYKKLFDRLTNSFGESYKIGFSLMNLYSDLDNLVPVLESGEYANILLPDLKKYIWGFMSFGKVVFWEMRLAWSVERSIVFIASSLAGYSTKNIRLDNVVD
jgi:hypothetical protein